MLHHCCCICCQQCHLFKTVHYADDKPADLTVFGNVFVRPRLFGTNTTSGSVTARRQLLQSGAFCYCGSSAALLLSIAFSKSSFHMSDAAVNDWIVMTSTPLSKSCGVKVLPCLDRASVHGSEPWQRVAVGVCSGTQTTTHSSVSSVNLTQLSNLTNAWQLDPVNLTEQYGLHIYGSGSATGLVVDSGSDDVRFQAAAAFGRRMLICSMSLPAIWHATVQEQMY